VDKNDDLESRKHDSDLERLSKVICMCLSYESGEFTTYPRYLSFRQSLYLGQIGLVKPGRPTETLDRTIVRMHDAICRSGEGSVDNLLASRCLAWCYKGSPVMAEKVFQTIGAIAYDMEWTSDTGELGISGITNAEVLADAKHTISPSFELDNYRFPALLEHMLLTDYFESPEFPVFRHSTSSSLSNFELDVMWSFERFSGFLTATAWRWRQGYAIPDPEAWELIVRVLEGNGAWSKGYFTWDVAVMLYHYHSRRKPVNAEARRHGWTGYTGILPEMLAEVHTRGTDRLQRKLSVDVHHFIPTHVKDREMRDEMIDIARDLASSCGCELGLPSTAPVPAPLPTPVPPPVPSPPDTSTWRAWFDGVLSFSSRGIRLEDEEKLIQGLEEEDSEKGAGGEPWWRRSERLRESKKAKESKENCIE
jgi:hypothetical protein